jgi:hypothetical protein
MNPDPKHCQKCHKILESKENITVPLKVMRKPNLESLWLGNLLLVGMAVENVIVSLAGRTRPDVRHRVPQLLHVVQVPCATQIDEHMAIFYEYFINPDMVDPALFRQSHKAQGTVPFVSTSVDPQLISGGGGNFVPARCQM